MKGLNGLSHGSIVSVNRLIPWAGWGSAPSKTLVALLSNAGRGSSGTVPGCRLVPSASCISSCCKTQRKYIMQILDTK